MKSSKNNTLKAHFLVCLTICICTVCTTLSGQSIFKNASNQIPQVTPTGADSFDSDLVDVDGDGDLDIFIAEGTAGFSGRANRLLINNQGFFTDVSESNLPISSNPANSISADYGDIDNDGDVDIVVTNLGPTQLLLNQGNGIFSDESINLLPPPPINIFEDISTEIGFEDVNKDGLLDIFIANEIPPIPDIGPGGAQNFLYIQNTDGTFSNESLSRLPNVKNQTGSFVFGDIDSDGDNDLIIANVGQNQVLINDGNGFFTNETELRISQQNTASRAMVLADIDNDTDLDLIIANSNSEQNQVFINDSKGFFQENTTNALPEKIDTSTDVKLFDFNYDGYLDIIFANSAPNPMGPAGGGHPLAPAPDILYINDGSGIFTDASSIFLPQNNDISFDIEIADVNGDCLDDILVSNANDGIEKLYLRDSTPQTQFTNIVPFTTCITDNLDGTLTATFGYTNSTQNTVYIPKSNRNKLIAATRNPPVIFFPGTHTDVLSATFRVSMAWIINKDIAIATRRNSMCDTDIFTENNDEDFNLEITNYPNPFSGSTTIKYTIPQADMVEILLYDQSGRIIKIIQKSYQSKGSHSIQLNATTLGLKNGMYFYKITSGQSSSIKSLIKNG